MKDIELKNKILLYYENLNYEDLTADLYFLIQEIQKIKRLENYKMVALFEAYKHQFQHDVAE